MNARIEAAAKAAFEHDNESARDGCRKWDETSRLSRADYIATEAIALAAADAVMFSDEAIGRVAVALWNHDFPSHPIENVAELLEWTRERRLEQARIVVAALKGDA